MLGAAWGAPVIGSTWTGLLRAVEQAPRGLFLIDDVVADSSPRKSKARIDDLVNYVSAGGSRVDGGRIVPPPLASIVSTSIYGPSKQVASSAYCVDVGLAPVHLRAMAFVETETARQSRGSLGSALETWISEAAGLEWIEQSFNEYLSETLAEEAALARMGQSLDPQFAAAFGIELMVMMLRDLDAVDSARCLEFTRWAREGIMSQMKRSLPQLEVGSSGLVGALREAIIHAMADGQVMVRGFGQRSANGPVIGEVRGDRVLLFPGEARDILSARVSKEYGPISSVRVARALEDERWISATADGKRARLYRFDGVVRRVWELPTSFFELSSGPPS